MTMFRGTFGAIQTLALAGSLVVGLGQTGCEKKRGLRFTQGSGDNLYEIKQFEGDTFKLKTGEKRFKGQTSRADELLTLNGFDKINSLDAVEFTIEDGLIAGIDISDFNFYGRENFEYTFKYSFTDYYVILSKVAAKSDIPSQELTFATDAGNGMYEVPLMGLPISLFTVEQVKDERGKPTRQITTFSRDYLSQASHFKVNPGQVKYFEAPNKPDLFTADFFNPNDEWFFTKTLVGRSISSNAILGETEASLKIKFARTNNSLIGVDLNIAKEQQVLDPTKTITALEIPVQWVDFKTDTAGPTARLKEQMLGDKEGSSRFWKERQYALVDFNNADRLDKAFTLDNKLEKLEVSNDYVSFTIYESSTGNTYKYSLAKSNRRVEGQRMYAEDTKLFHVFADKRTVINGNLYTQEPDLNKLVFANRFYPENGEIVFHISKNTPNQPEFIEAIQNSVTAWDKAFNEAGTDIRIRLSDERVDVGDVRYNQIVFYGYEIDSSMEGGGVLLGFGPSVQDSRSGQTFSAATHIYLRAYREGIIRNIRNFVRNELGLYEDKTVSGVPLFASSDAALEGGTILASTAVIINGRAGLYNYFQSTPGLFDRAPEGMKEGVLSRIAQFDDVDSLQNASKAHENKKLTMQTANGPVCEFANVAASTNSWRKIRESCLVEGNPFAEYLGKLKAEHSSDPSVLNGEGEEEAILACAQPLMKELLTSTLVHEIGHNFGLGHNFAASSDAANFAKDEQGRVAYPSSSVMDYPARDFDLYDRVGPYDVAAIRYLYGRKVETVTGDILDIPANKSIFRVAKEVNTDLKNYEMCTDVLNANNAPFFNPLCLKWDIGAKPQEYVKWAISQIHADIIQNGYIYNNARFIGSGGGLSYFTNFKQIHDYFRFLIGRKAGAYLEYVTDENDLVENVIKPSKDKNLADYYEATKLIFDFARQVIELAPRVCMLTVDGEAPFPFQFQILRNAIYETEQKTVQNCKQAEPFLGPLFGNEAGPATVKAEDRGTDLFPLELNLDPTSASDKLKRGFSFGISGADLSPTYSSGVVNYKLAAVQLLTDRNSTLASVQNSGGTYNFLDIPWFKKTIYDSFLAQALLGVDGTSIDPSLAGAKIPFFQETGSVNSVMLSSLFRGSNLIYSQAYTDARNLTPSIEQNTSNLYKWVRDQADTVVFVKNAKNQVVYASKGYIAAIIDRLVKMNQVSALTSLADAKVKPVLTDRLKVQLTNQNELAVSNQEKMVRASFTLLDSLGLALQPGQVRALELRLAKFTADTGLAAEGVSLLDNAPGIVDQVQGFLQEALANPTYQSVKAFQTQSGLDFQIQRRTLQGFVETF
jgi:hypothetical protein